MGKAVDSTAPLMAAGLDSLAAVELRNAVSSKFGVNLPATLAFDYPTLEALSTFIAASLGSCTPQGAHPERSSKDSAFRCGSRSFYTGSGSPAL